MNAGSSVNAIYVPEDWDAVVTAQVPDDDAQLIAAVLDAPPPPPAPAGPHAPVCHSTFFDVDRFNTLRTVSPGAYAAHIEFVRPVSRIAASVTREQEVVVRNLGDERWSSGHDAAPLIRLGYRWRRSGSQGELVAEGPRTAFTEVVAPGADTLAQLRVDAPDEPGSYVLEVDVVHEHVRWFDTPARLEVQVEGGEATGTGGPGRRAFLAQARRFGLDPERVLSDHAEWAQSLRPERTPLADGAPWVTFAARRALDAACSPGTIACEYGSGGSTVYLLERAQRLTTIEWDADWAPRVEASIDPTSRERWMLMLRQPISDADSAPIDPSDPGGYVSAARSLRGMSFRSYAEAIDRYEADTFDLVLVAGRARPSCLTHALPKVAPGGLLVLDHAERPWYGPALALANSSDWVREDHLGPGPYAERFWQTTILRRRT
jgi:hypothetical protein